MPRNWSAWTTQQIADLKRLYPTMGAKRLAESGLMGGHGVYAVRQEAHKRGIKYVGRPGPTPGIQRRRKGDPTEAEIRAMCAELRKERIA